MPRAKGQADTHTMSLRLDKDLFNTFKKIADEQDRTTSQLVRDFIREYVKKNQQNKLF